MKRLMVLLLLLVPVLVQAQTSSLYAQAELLLSKADTAGAIKMLKRGSKQGDTSCKSLLGEVYMLQGKYKKAEKCFKDAGDDKANFRLGAMYLDDMLGQSTSADYRYGVNLIRRSHQQGYRDATFTLARLYFVGYVVDQRYDSAIYYLQQLVDRGDSAALCQMGVFYESGYGVEIDTATALAYYLRAGDAGLSNGYDYAADIYRFGTSSMAPDSAKAFLYYSKAAELGGDNANGLYDLAVCYLKGIGTAVDTATAVPLLRQAYASGSANAAAKLGDFFEEGQAGFPFDFDSAMAYYYSASQGDHPRGDFMIGAYLYDEGAYENAISFLSSAISNGSSDAAILYACALLYGRGVEADPQQAIDILNQSIPDDATGTAHLYLGMAYYSGLGVEESIDEALAHFDTSVSMGCSQAMRLLGLIYAKGEIVERDTVKAVELYEHAAQVGDIKAMKDLAGSYTTGQVAPKNLKRAAELYQMAADRGDLDAMCYLGRCYQEGNGVVLNTRRAYNLFLNAAERGSAWAMRLVGICYMEGTYVENSEEQAFEWFHKAAEAGDVQSCYLMGLCYAQGTMVKKNKKEAKRWLTIAAENGHPQAAELLQSL